MPDIIVAPPEICEASQDAAAYFLTVYDKKETSDYPKDADTGSGKIQEGLLNHIKRITEQRLPDTYTLEDHAGSPINVESELKTIKAEFLNSLKDNEDLRYTFLFDSQTFSHVCAEILNAVKTSYKTNGIPFESDHVFVAGDFPIELSPDDQKIMALITEKKDAFERLRAALPEAIKGALELEPDAVEKALRFEGNALEIAINGLLARNIIYKSEHTNADEKKYDEKTRLKETMDLFRLDDPRYPNTPNVAKMLAEFPDVESASPDRIFNKIISNIVCTKEYLQELQNKPAYLNQPSRSVG